jgi:HEAT repeat protein
MSDPHAPEFAGTDEELEKYLLEFARGVGGWVVRDPKRGERIVAAGSLLSTNPNTIAWRLHVTREDGKIRIASSARALPWTRAKVARIAAFRRGQLEDFLTARSRGGGKEGFDALRLREPFANFGSGGAAITASIAWSVACGLGAMAAAMVAMTLVSLPLMGVAIAEILERARVVQAAGGVALPHPDRPLSLAGAALVFAVPLAFFGGFVHAAALAAGELWARAARLPAASFLFLTILIALALFPFTPIAALPAAVAAPLAIHAGYTLVWGRRRERVREGRRPGKAILVAAAVLVGLTALSLVPRPAGEDWNNRLALFRDRWMLGHPLGRWAAATYYRHTMVGADLIKHFYSADATKSDRDLRTAGTDDPAFAKAFRDLDFTVTSDPGANVDVRVRGGTLSSGSSTVAWNGDVRALPALLDRLARETFRGGMLYELYVIAWRSLYYAGPIFILFVVIGAFCPGFSAVFRLLRPRAALAAVAACFAAAVALLALGAGGDSASRQAALDLLRSPGPANIGQGLGHPSPVVRHAAAFLSFVHPDSSLGPALVKAADDEDFRIRLWASAALGKTRHPDALAKLLERLKDPEFFVRYRAAEGLGFLGRTEAVEPLLAMARDGTWYEGLYALEALRRIAPGKY